MLKTLREWILHSTADLSPEAMRVEGSWLLNLNYQPFITERLFQYDVALVQVQATGAAYSGYDTLNKSELNALVNKDARELITEEYSPVNIALLDAVAASLSPEADEKIFTSGRNKAIQRAEVVVNEVQKLCRERVIPQRPKVVNVGAIGCIIAELKRQNMHVTATDLDENIVSKKLADVEISDGALHTNEFVADADLAIVTGMCIGNGTLPEIVKIAEKNNTRIMIVAETGAGLGRAYCDLFNIDVVVAEPFPFYIFNCRSEMLIYRK